MSKERQLLKEFMSYFARGSIAISSSNSDIGQTLSEAQELLAQPEQAHVACSLLSDQYIEDKSPSYDMTIHDNPDALAWTRFFRETNPDCNVDDDEMFGRFANAMMAMHDHTCRNTAPQTRKPLSEYELTEACLLKGQAYASAFTDGVEFAEKAHGIGE